LLGALGQRRKSVLREPRAAVDGDLAGNLAVAAIDQHVGDRLVDLGSLRYGQEMILALLARDLDQIAGRELLGVLEHRAGNNNLIVLGEMADDLARRAVDRS